VAESYAVMKGKGSLTEASRDNLTVVPIGYFESRYEMGTGTLVLVLSITGFDPLPTLHLI
jgi:hypothetical protein